MARSSNPLFEPAKLLIMTPRPSIAIPGTRKFIAKVQRTSGKAARQDRLIKICTGAGFPTTVDVGQYFHDKGH